MHPFCENQFFLYVGISLRDNTKFQLSKPEISCKILNFPIDNTFIFHLQHGRIIMEWEENKQRPYLQIISQVPTQIFISARSPYEFLVGQSNSIAGMTVATNKHTGGPRIMSISLLIFFKTFLVFKGQLISKGLFGILEFFLK